MAVELTGRVAIVTGAAQGIGAATARKLAERGARVVGVDIEADLLKSVMGEIGGVAVVQDVTDADGDQRLVDDVLRAFGRVDILVNVAGGTLGAGRGIDELTIEDWHRVVALNLDAPLYLSKAVAPIMKQQGWGRIISVGSGAGRSHSRSKVVPYAAAKAGLMGLMRQLAVDLAPHGITCNTVSPGFILTERGRDDWERRDEAQKAREMDTIAAGRLGAPQEIADVIAFVASDEASYMVGQTISVDGGHWMF
ncbi:MAG TPA: SDR family NAD(P)-dependent oxidoreductase [Thermomicrobiaceae bacterium]|nr:SDR family NAD(P)-dependent oxidoreductase [Thermomicrobiaceae bacterium]